MPFWLVLVGGEVGWVGKGRMPFRSWPAQKERCFPPGAPVMMAQRREGSVSYQVQREWSSQWLEVGRLLRCVGRLIVARRIWGVGKERRMVGVGGGGEVNAIVWGLELDWGIPVDW